MDPLAAWHEEDAYFSRLLHLVQEEVDTRCAGGTPNYELMLDILWNCFRRSPLAWTGKCRRSCSHRRSRSVWPAAHIEKETRTWGVAVKPSGATVD